MFYIFFYDFYINSNIFIFFLIKNNFFFSLLGIIYIFSYNCFVFLAICSHLRAMLTDPGIVPISNEK